MSRIVISAISLRKGGTLTILRQCLEYLSQRSAQTGDEIIALVHRRDLCDYPNIRYIELPEAISSWGSRLSYEYRKLLPISEELAPVDLWLSMHDTTPRIKARRQAVYCQTSFPFMRWRFRDFRYDPKIPLFALFTRLVYRYRVHHNRYLIVQQEWLREGLSKLLGVAPERFIVAPPAAPVLELQDRVAHDEATPYTFLYAATPDAHKNFETLCQASALLEKRVGKGRFRTVLTISGKENKYAQSLYERWGSCESIVFRGFLSREELRQQYADTDCMVFPSRIETWGLPLSEFKGYERPMLVSDLPFAHETTSGAKAVAFFPPENATRLSQLMQEMLEGDTRELHPVPVRSKGEPTAASWAELFDLLLAGL